MKVSGEAILAVSVLVGILIWRFGLVLLFVTLVGLLLYHNRKTIDPPHKECQCKECKEIRAFDRFLNR